MKEKGLLVRQIMTGVISGTVGGFFGAGGGVFAVLMYEKLLKLSAKESHACAVATMLPISVVTAIIYYLHGQVNISLSVKTAIGALAGGFIAGWLFKKIKSNVLSRIFGGVMVATGVWMLCR